MLQKRKFPLCTFKSIKSIWRAKWFTTSCNITCIWILSKMYDLYLKLVKKKDTKMNVKNNLILLENNLCQVPEDSILAETYSIVSSMTVSSSYLLAIFVTKLIKTLEILEY